jgi:hypothetical protein
VSVQLNADYALQSMVLQNGGSLYRFAKQVEMLLQQKQPALHNQQNEIAKAAPPYGMGAAYLKILWPFNRIQPT